MKPVINWFLLSCASASILSAGPVIIKATGVDVKTGQKIFTETGRARYKDGYLISSEIEFAGIDGKVYTRQKINAKKSPYAPDYTLEDLRDGHLEAVFFNGATYEILFKDNAAAPGEKVTLRIPGNEIATVTFPGFSNFALKHWDILSRGEAVFFYLIVPTQRDFYRFRLVRDSITGSGISQRVHFRIELVNLVLRMFVDPIRISFDVSGRRMVRYEGIHFVRDLPKFLGRRLRVDYQKS